MGFFAAVKSCLAGYVRFSGRARRAEYWWFALLYYLVVVAAMLLDLAVFGEEAPILTDTPRLVLPLPILGGAALLELAGSGVHKSIYGSVAQLALLLLMLAVSFRRLHDTGRPGWFMFLPSLLFVASTIAIPVGARLLVSFEQVVTAFASIGMLSMILCNLVLLWWLTRPSQPGANRYGGESPADVF